MLQYDANTGGFAKLGDRVTVVRSGVPTDGLTGTIGGWGDYGNYIALVALDEPMDDGRTIVGNFTFLRAKITGFDGGIIDSIIEAF